MMSSLRQGTLPLHSGCRGNRLVAPAVTKRPRDHGPKHGAFFLYASFPALPRQRGTRQDEFENVSRERAAYPNRWCSARRNGLDGGCVAAD